MASKVLADSNDDGVGKEKLQQQKVAWVVLQYWVVSISMVYLNKFLMSGTDTAVPAPLFVTFFQCVVTCLICYICGKLRGGGGGGGGGSGGGAALAGSNGAGKGDSGLLSQFPPAEYRLSVARRVMPLSLIFVGMITFNNLCLQYVEVSFYNVARSLTIVFNVIFSLFILGQRTSCATIFCLAVVVFGFYLGTSGEINFSLVGTVSGVLSSMFVSLNSIYIKKALAIVNNDLWRLTFVNNVNACILFIPLIAYFELGTLREKLPVFLMGTFWIGMTVAGIFGFAIGIVTGMQIKATSPLTHNISGTAKAAVQSVTAFYIWGNQPTIMGLLGIAFVLAGSGLYTYVKVTESRRTVRDTLLPTSSSNHTK